jgi:L-threonylcarbamoyladenylate synthase
VLTVGADHPLGVDPEVMAQAIEALSGGSVVALPTDTVYGLAVDPSVPGAVERIFTLKGRPRDVALPILVGTKAQVEEVTGGLGGAAGYLADRYWPGPLTLVVPRRPGYSADLGGPTSPRQSVGVRWPDHPVVQALCRSVGPLAVTSANPHTGSPATTAHQVAEAFEGSGQPAVIVDGGVCDGVPSTVVECRGATTRCLRSGAVPWDDIIERSGGSSSGGWASIGGMGRHDRG